MITIVCFLSRAHGFEVLEKIMKLKKYQILRVYTHKLKPKSEDPSRNEREDYKLFENVCEENSIPIFAVDSKDENIDEGDQVVLIGEQNGNSITVEEMSVWAETIPYEILTNLNDRIPRIYSNG